MKIAATFMPPGNQPPLPHDKKEEGIPHPPTPPLTRVKYVCTVSILYWRGVGEGGDDCNLRTDERGGYKTTKKHIHEIASKNLSSGNPLNSMKFASMMKRWAGLLPSPPTPPLTQFKYARTVYYTGSGKGGERMAQSALNNKT